MAKVKIQGNASGTGVLTVTAPNTSTDRTVTLPDSTDTLATETQFKAAGGRKNLIINGGMKVAQRGTSFSMSTANMYLTDRFRTSVGSGYDLDTTITQSTDVPSGEGFKYSLQFDADTVQTPALSENGGFSCFIEGNDVAQLGYGNSNAKDLTLSFWVKSNKTGTYGLQVQSRPSSGDGKYTLYSYTVTSSWTKITISIPKNTVQSLNTSEATGLKLHWWLASGPSDIVSATTTWTANPAPTFRSVTGQVNFMDSTSNTFNITGVQLELGSTATDFEHRSYGEELALRQRYYWRIGSTVASPYARYGLGYAPSTTLVRLSIQNEFREIPSVYYSGNFAVQPGTGGTVTFSVLSNGSTSNSVTVNCNVSSVSLGDCVSVHTDNDTDAYLALDAEL